MGETPFFGAVVGNPMRLPKYFLKSKLFIAIKFLIRHIFRDNQRAGIEQMNQMALDIWEVEIETISEFWVIGKLQYTRIYGKLKRRKKILLIGKSMMIKLMMKRIIINFVVAVIICREFNNLMSNLLGWSGYFNRNVNRITRYSRDMLVRCWFSDVW